MIDKPILIAVVRANDLVNDMAVSEIELADMIEFRADLQENLTIAKFLEQINYIKSISNSKLLFTLRDFAEGGQSSCSCTERTEIYRAILPYVDAIDIEIMNAEVFCALQADLKNYKTLSILSFHNFEKTPTLDELKQIICRAEKYSPKIIKIAAMCQTQTDVLRLLELPILFENLQIATLAMGEFGKAQRMIAPKFRSVLGYAALNKSVAPGQLSVKEMRMAWDML